MIERFEASDGAKIAYRISGTGPALLCLSGLTRNSTDFDYVAPYLTGVTMIAMDYRGRGASDWSGADSYTVEREAHDALELLDHLGIDKAAILGTSRGGLIGMVLGAMAADRFTGLMLNDVGPELGAEGLATIKGYVGRNPKEKTLEEAVEMRASLMAGFEGVPRERWAEEVERHYVQTPDGLTVNYDPELATAVMKAFEGPIVDVWPVFDALGDMPLALVRGANSNLLAAETMAEMVKRRPDMIAANVPGRGHVPFLDEPEALAVLDRFLEAIP